MYRRSKITRSASASTLLLPDTFAKGPDGNDLAHEFVTRDVAGLMPGVKPSYRRRSAIA